MDFRGGIEARIEQSLDSTRPYLHADGGDVKLIRFRPEGVLELQWIGTCAVCPMSQLTLRAGIERAVMHDVPEVRRVEAVTL
ncbi:MAG: nitrogen-fixing NifU domain protein [Bacteroidetes bacterium]|jgi:Fe-S cluster biogenesis protein NfuA|nr:nitrogen-fixing NifU domain protein [Bacteroidota bacterium]